MTILITGASRGIGADLARKLALSGHKLILLSRTKDKITELSKECNSLAKNEIAFPLAYDMNNILTEPESFLSEFLPLSKELDTLVNNAGALVKKPFSDISHQEALEVFNTNYFAPAALIKCCLPLLKKSSEASIINVTSMAAVQGASKFPGLSAYGASKGALATLTESLAEEFKDDHIRVNALAFGAVQTEMLAEAFPGYKASTSPEEMADFFSWFVLEGWKRFNGKMLQVSDSTP